MHVCICVLMCVRLYVWQNSPRKTIKWNQVDK
jgi:hypothetical protein